MWPQAVLWLLLTRGISHKVRCHHMDTRVLAFVCSNQPFNFTFLPGDEVLLRMSSISSVDIQLLMRHFSVFKWPYALSVQSLWSDKCTQIRQMLRSGDVWPHHSPQGSIAGYHIKAVWPAYCHVLASPCSLLLWTIVHLNPLLVIFLVPSVLSHVYQLQRILSRSRPSRFLYLPPF